VATSPQPPAGPRSRGAGATRVILVVAFASLVLFWVALLVDDAAISPIAVIDLPGSVIIALAVVHVVSAPVGWVTAVVELARFGRRGAVVFGVTVVPFAALMTFGVMLSDALVWRGDRYDWVGMLLLALSGPVALTLLLGIAHRAGATIRRVSPP